LASNRKVSKLLGPVLLLAGHGVIALWVSGRLLNRGAQLVSR
jgi:hypothetical protein